MRVASSDGQEVGGVSQEVFRCVGVDVKEALEAVLTVVQDGPRIIKDGDFIRVVKPCRR